MLCSYTLMQVLKMLTYRQSNRELHYIVSRCREPLREELVIKGSTRCGVAGARVVRGSRRSQFDVAHSFASGVGCDGG